LNITNINCVDVKPLQMLKLRTSDWFDNYIVLICQVFLVFIIYDALLLFYIH